MKFLMSLLNRYTQRLQKHPYSTKIITTGLIFSLSDYICQTYVEKKGAEDYSYARTFRQGMTGAFVLAPTLHVWHCITIPFVTNSIKSKTGGIVASYILGNLVLTPFNLATILFAFDYLRTFDVESGIKNMKEKWWSAVVKSFWYWGVISLFTYSVVPVIYRPVFTNCFGLIWQVYVSYIANLRTVKVEEVLELSK